MVDEEGESRQSKGNFTHLAYKLQYKHTVQVDNRGELTSYTFDFYALLLLYRIFDSSEWLMSKKDNVDFHF